tara:strand:- start:1571 stop:1831 length:261 start_codon:yes stop_codon:yes gene_type:complete
MVDLPSESLTIRNPDGWEAEARAFAADMIARGERPWFEVRWPAPDGLSAEDAAVWMAEQEATFDAIELVDGVFVTVPPYAELAGGS